MPVAVVTLTVNPSVDRTLTVDAFERGAVLRASSVTVVASGKGVNVSRALAANGHATRAVLALGGWEGDQLRALADAEGVALVTVEIDGATRANVTVAERDGTTTKLNEPGPVLSAATLEALLDATLAEAAALDGWICASGSLTPGAPVDSYATLVHRAAGRTVVVDAAGPALEAALPARPALVKPNASEAAGLVGVPLHTIGDCVEAAHAIRARGARAVLLSMGVDGALLVDASGVHHGEALVHDPRDATGAGDALLAGFLAGGACGRDGLHTALTWAWGKLRLTGTRMPTPADLADATVVLHDEVDPSRPLREGARP